MKDITASTLLRELGTKPDSNISIHDFPKILKPEFMELYNEFIKSKHAERILKLSPKNSRTAKLNVIHAFISYTMNSKPLCLIVIFVNVMDFELQTFMFNCYFC